MKIQLLPTPMTAVTTKLLSVPTLRNTLKSFVEHTLKQTKNEALLNSAQAKLSALWFSELFVIKSVFS